MRLAAWVKQRFFTVEEGNGQTNVKEDNAQTDEATAVERELMESNPRFVAFAAMPC
jgi:hypothetical protein